MTVTILTLFPDMIRPFVEQSMLGRAQRDGHLTIDIRNLRDWATDRHQTVDDAPYGGGAGMVLRVDVIDRALAELRQIPDTKYQIPEVVLLTPQGERFTQPIAEQLATTKHNLILIAGHYEGFDERIRSLVDRELSLGDFVLTGGELPAVAVVDAVTRLLPGVLAEGSATEESHSMQVDQSFDSAQSEPLRLLEYPHYTRPEIYQPISRQSTPLGVPEILKSGNHRKIAAWRLEQARLRTPTLNPSR
ncbi:tRNA (guanosine(37)-N1)-methyltransferase TrmD [Candidatus Berkelbacteria bacterium]|nr:tRNA (guanosine(37)-N1)-methyltransferase TrmD [Candidatus Berkelbacteria bacterium]